MNGLQQLFLQPLFLWALPLVALPIVIHLINQNRHRTLPWAATMFLLQAQRMVRGIAKLRYWLIMLMRMAAIAGLIFAISRPMAGGWLATTVGGAPETTIILLDRSASMEQVDPTTGRSKREAGLLKLANLLRSNQQATKILLLDSASPESHDARPLHITNVDALLDITRTAATQTQADLPSLTDAACRYIIDHQTGRTDIWVVSDLQSSNWRPESGAWQSARRTLSQREGCRLFLLNYSQPARDNLSLRISNVYRRQTVGEAELVMDLRVDRQSTSEEPKSFPISFVIDGARSTLQVELTGSQYVRNGHTIPIDRLSQQGYGRVELPNDENIMDNSFCFVYAQPTVRTTTIVSDDANVHRSMRLATETPLQRDLETDVTVLSPSAALSIDWEQTALIVWQAELPEGIAAQQLNNFVASGKTVIFFPPSVANVSSASIFGTSWGNWIAGDKPTSIGRWRTDSDLLSNTRDGSPLPVGDLNTYRFRKLNASRTEPDGGLGNINSVSRNDESESRSVEGNAVAQGSEPGSRSRGIVLAQLEGGDPLLVRLPTDSGAVYFCSTLPLPDHSNLIENGIVFYVMLQRALDRGVSALGQARNLDCGIGLSGVEGWKPLDAVSSQTLISQRGVISGAYDTGDYLIAINRPENEDSTAIMDDETLKQTLSGIEFTRVDDMAGSDSGLTSEVWRIFLVVMLAALIGEAALSLPQAEATGV
ncbi:MAG: BatA domain-containing protein [Pirellulaceae bacterium]